MIVWWTKNRRLHLVWPILGLKNRERKKSERGKRERATKGEKHLLFPSRGVFFFLTNSEQRWRFYFFLFLSVLLLSSCHRGGGRFLYSRLFLNRFKLERIFSQIQINRHAGGVPGPWEPKGEAVLVLESIQLSPLLCFLPATSAFVTVCWRRGPLGWPWW